MKALIISLNFHPGHVSHMVASYKQCEELGYQSIFYVDSEFENYLPHECRMLINGRHSCPVTDIVIFLFPSQKNLPLIWKMKRKGVRVVYIFHEPLSPMSDYRKAGFSYKYLAKLWVINRISQLTVKWSDLILLPSRKAVDFYEKNPLYKNRNYHYLPLMYDDERRKRHELLPRIYFSYIGTIAADHSFGEFLNFAEWAIRENRMPEFKFLIATKSSFTVPDILKDSQRITIQQGRPLTDEEINAYYVSTIVVWNAYARTTQSGVLAKSFMFGTPAIVLRKNCNEFAHDGIEIKAIEDNTNKDEIAAAIVGVKKDFMAYSSNCRKRFEESFYYRKYNEQFRELIEKL